MCKMTDKLQLPIGIEDFKEMRTGGYYYVDKTKLIERLALQKGKVNLITRPRRFGKTLNMSMLRYFFEMGADKALFDGLYISKCHKIIEQYMGKYPVIFLSLKNITDMTFEKAKYSLTETIAKEARRFSYILDGDRLSEDDKNLYRALVNRENGVFTLDERVLPSAINSLSELLYTYYEHPVILLIDEYDVPLDKAFQYNYYPEMVNLLRGVLGQALKTNEYLAFAVLTGCLRIFKESVFTGLNNFKMLSITDAQFDEEFGFLEQEVVDLLNAYHLENHLEEIKEWYDGYRFGDTDIYCPWDVINHVDRLCINPETLPQAYWINSSSNNLVKLFIDKADKTTRDEIEKLVAGETIEKEVRLNLTYDELESNIDNLWSVLFTTGYLTTTCQPDNGFYRLKIPNNEIRQVFIYHIREWFREELKKDTTLLQNFWDAIATGNEAMVENELTMALGKTISIIDTKGPEKERESFYHVFLAGILVGNRAWSVESNKESGEGFADLLIKPENPNKGIILELKSVAKYTELEKACEKAIQQIHEKDYAASLREDGREDVWAYGIAFYKKRCKVKVEHISIKNN